MRNCFPAAIQPFKLRHIEQKEHYVQIGWLRLLTLLFI